MKYFLFLLLYLLGYKATAQGLSDWQHDTPGRNSMGDAGTGTFLQVQGTEKRIPNIRRWYFYQNRIIGETNREYFVFEEATGNMKLFDRENTYQCYLASNGLKPRWWTRWYSDNWVTNDLLGTLLVFWFFISIPFALCFIWAIYAVAKFILKAKAPLTVTLVVSLLLLLLVLLSDMFPQSF